MSWFSWVPPSCEFPPAGGTSRATVTVGPSQGQCLQSSVLLGPNPIIPQVLLADVLNSGQGELRKNSFSIRAFLLPNLKQISI